MKGENKKTMKVIIERRKWRKCNGGENGINGIEEIK
jgi:hypothetical protein